jgi:hypothetical protein
MFEQYSNVTLVVITQKINNSLFPRRYELQTMRNRTKYTMYVRYNKKWLLSTCKKKNDNLIFLYNI